MHVILDARELGSREQAHAYLKRIFSLPDYYGCNLDALHDCLSELPYADRLGIHLLHAKEAGEYYPKVRKVLEELPGAQIHEIES